MPDQPSNSAQPETAPPTSGPPSTIASATPPTATSAGSAQTTAPTLGDADALPLRTSTDIQGNILAGFRKDHQVFVFLGFPDNPTRAQGWLNDLLPSISATREVAAFNARFSAARHLNGGDDPENLQSNWVNVALTAGGLRRLGSPQVLADVNGTVAQEFPSFVAGAAEQAVNMGDVAPDSDPSRWLVGAPGQPAVDAILTVAADDRDDLLVQMEKLRALASKHGLVTIFEQRGNTLPGERAGHEHFGFKDGISQPGVRGFDKPGASNSNLTVQGRSDEVEGSTGTKLVAASQFVLGTPDETGMVAKNFPSWMNNGSFQVWRRLTQDVPGFWSQVTSQLQAQNPSLPPTDPATEDQLAAKLMGRWRSGTPVDAAPNADDRSSRDPQDDNDFNFGGRDAEGNPVALSTSPSTDIQGMRCPVDAHIRKMNPRNGGEASRRIMRRGIPFGLPFDPAAGRGQGVDADRGLLFVAFMASIETQYEFLQSMWANQPFPAGGHDPIIGLPDVTHPTHTHTLLRNGLPEISLTLQRFVQTTGAIYAFAPSLTTLKALATGTLL